MHLDSLATAMNNQRHSASDTVSSIATNIHLHSRSHHNVTDFQHYDMKLKQIELANRAFAAAEPGVWNSLPSHLKEADLS